MLALSDSISQSLQSLRAHKLRTVLTTLGLTMGVATLITVMTLVQGANLYVEQKIARLGTNVFQIARTPFVPTDLDAVIKSLRYKKIFLDDVGAIAARCPHCQAVGATGTSTVSVHAQNRELQDVNLIGQTANMARIDTRDIAIGRYFTESEDDHSALVCLVGDQIVQEFFPGQSPLGRTIRAGNTELTIIGTFEKIGAVLGQDQDSYVIVPINTFLRMEGSRTSLTINVQTASDRDFEMAQDEARLTLRSRRHISGNAPEDFFIGTRESYISLWQSISGAFFAVFILVSSISAVVGGIVIMNVMLVSVTERTREIGVRSAVGASRSDILRQFLTESVLQCLMGGTAGVAGGFVCALLLRTFTSFPASVQTWVAVLGLVLSSLIGLFFGIYPASRAARLDPVVALRSGT